MRNMRLGKQQVTQKKEANFLFTEMAEDKLSGQLPFHEISDEEFGERMLYRRARPSMRSRNRRDERAPFRISFSAMRRRPGSSCSTC